MISNFSLLPIRVMRRLRAGGAASTAAWLVFSQVIAAGTSFLVNIIAAYALDPTQRGLLAFALQLGYFLTIAALFGTERPFIRQVRSSFEDSVKLLLSVLRPGLFVLLLLAIATVIAWVKGDHSLAQAGAWLLLMVVGNVHLRVVRATYIVSGAKRIFIMVTVVTQSLTLGMALVLAYFQVGDFTLWLAGYALALLAPTLVLGKWIVGRATPDDDLFRSIQTIRRDGLRLFPASIGNTAMFRSDRLLLPILASPAQLGLYIVVAAALEVAVWPVQQWADSKLHSWQKAGGGIGQRAALAILLKSMLFVLLISLGISVLLIAVVLFILPYEYRGSLELIAPIIVANVVYGATRTQQGLAIAAGRSGQVSIAEVAGMLVSVASYILLMPSIGAFGAAIGSIIGYIACLLVGFVGWKRAGREVKGS